MAMASISRHVMRGVFSMRAIVIPGLPSATVRALSDMSWQGAPSNGHGGGGDQGMMRGGDKPARSRGDVERKPGDW